MDRKILFSSLLIAGVAGQASAFYKIDESYYLYNNGANAGDGRVTDPTSKFKGEYGMEKYQGTTKLDGVFPPTISYYCPRAAIFNALVTNSLVASLILNRDTNICLFFRAYDDVDQENGATATENLVPEQAIPLLFLCIGNPIDNEHPNNPFDEFKNAYYIDDRLKGIKIVKSELVSDFKKENESKGPLYDKFINAAPVAAIKKVINNSAAEVDLKKGFSKEGLVSLSGIKVYNKKEGGVQLSRKGDEKTLDFQAALLNYISKYVNSSYGETIGEIGEVIYHKEDRQGNPINNLLLMNKNLYNKESLKLLKDSEILAVWHLLETNYKNPKNETEEKTVNQRLVGVAKGSDGKLFHWATDLGQDIEVLYNQ